MAECPICGATIPLSGGARFGEQLRCANCASELEVLDPYTKTLGRVPDPDLLDDGEDDDWE